MATVLAQTGKTIRERFAEFNQQNPKVYELFKKFAFYLIKEKRMTSISGRLLLERIRWEIHAETTGEIYRINNNYTPYYVRLFVLDFPEYKNKFELRVLKSAQPC